MKVLYDHQIFSSFAFGGVSRIFFELMNAYSNESDIDFALSLKYTDNEYLHDAAWITGVRPYMKNNSDARGFEFPVQLARNFLVKRINNYRKKENRKQSKRIIAQGEYDIFHPTYYDPYFLDCLHDKPFVLTVYDMIYELFPEYFPSSLKILEWKSVLAQEAAKIIAISESTKKDLMKFYHLPSEKIEVIYLANSLKSGAVIQKGKVEELKLPERYLLYVGNRAMYKNFFFFVESIVPLLTEDQTLSLVCAGGKDFDQAERRFFRTWNVERKLHYVPINDAILASLYKNALAFVFPSLYEGFGIPVLEAFELGCPAILSSVSSLPEIGGSAAVYFSPTDNNDIRKKVEQVVGSTSLRDELRVLGNKRALDFSWSKTARETKEVYQKIMEA